LSVHRLALFERVWITIIDWLDRSHTSLVKVGVDAIDDLGALELFDPELVASRAVVLTAAGVDLGLTLITPGIVW